MTLNANKRNTNFSYLQNIYMVDTAVGSGKTYTAINYMLEPENTKRNFIYVAPRVELCGQIENDISNNIKLNNLRQRPVVIINHKTSGNTSSDILNSVDNTAPDSGTIHIITTTTFIRLLCHLRYQNQHSVILDEAFEPSSHIPFYSKEKLSHCIDLFTVQKNDRVVVNKEKNDAVYGIANNDFGLDFNEYQIPQIIEMCQSVINDAIWCEYAERTEHKVTLATYLTPEYVGLFDEIIFLSALFKHTILYSLWINQFEINFKEHDYFEGKKKTGEIHDTHKGQGKNIKIMYLLDKQDSVSRYNLERNCKTAKPKEKIPGDRVIDCLNALAHQIFDNSKYLLALNKWSMLNVIRYENAEIITTKTHGSNSYSHHTNVTVLASTNPTPSHANWLSNITKLDISQIYEAYNLDTAYQTFGRCAIRDRNNEDEIQLVVLSYNIAKLLNGIFPESTLVGKYGDIPNLVKQCEANSTAKIGRPKQDDSLRDNLDYQAHMKSISRYKDMDKLTDNQQKKLDERKRKAEKIRLEQNTKEIDKVKHKML